MNGIMQATLAALASSLLLAACDGPNKSEVIFKQERQTLDKAKGVQQQVEQQTEETRKRLEQAEQP